MVRMDKESIYVQREDEIIHEELCYNIIYFFVYFL